MEQNFKSHFLCLKTYFLAQNYTPSAFPWFSSETKKIICSIFREVSFQKQLQYNKPPGTLILLKFCQNVPNRQKVKVTKFRGARLSRFRVMVNYMTVRAKSPPPPPILRVTFCENDTKSSNLVFVPLRFSSWLPKILVLVRN